MSLNNETDPMLNASTETSLKSEYREHSKWTVSLVVASSAAVLGSSFQFGYNTGVINTPATTIKEFYNKTYYERHGVAMDSFYLTFLWSLTVSIFAVGGMIGSFGAGYLANRIGRKRAMLVNNIPAIIAAVLMGCSKTAKSYELLIVGRFIIGINCGFNTGLAPLYLTEIAPTAFRGQLGTLNQMGIVSALLLSQILGLSNVLGGESTWPILLGLTGAFSVYQLIILPFCEESPKYLVKQEKYKDATKALQWLRNQEDVSNELESNLKEEESSSETTQVGIKQIFTTSSLRKPMIIAIVMQLSQQFSGINAVFYYSTNLFLNAGISQNNARYVTVGMGICNVVMTLISVMLIERAGRRLLHLIGLGGMFICSIVLTISLSVLGSKSTSAASIISIIAVILFVAAFQTGPGSIPWFITAELFNQSVKSRAISIAGLVNWSGNFIVGLAYPPLAKVIGGYTFLIFAVLLALSWLFTFFFVPETKGKTIDEITAKFT